MHKILDLSGANATHGGHGDDSPTCSNPPIQPTHPDLDAAVKAVEDALLEHVHDLAQRWLVDPAARKIYIRTMLHDSVTATTGVSDGRRQLTPASHRPILCLLSQF